MVSVINIIYIVSVDILHSKHKAEAQLLAFVPFVSAEKIIGKWNESGKTFVDLVSVHLAPGSQMTCKLYSRVQLLWFVSRSLRYCKSYPAPQTTTTGHFRSLILPPFVLRTQLIHRPPPLALLQTVERGGVDAAGQSAAWNKPPYSSARKKKRKKEEALFFVCGWYMTPHKRARCLRDE